MAIKQHLERIIGIKQEPDDIKLLRRNQQIREDSKKLEIHSLKKVNALKPLDYTDFDNLNQQLLSFKDQKTYFINGKLYNKCRGHKTECTDLIEARYAVYDSGKFRSLEKYFYCNRCWDLIQKSIREAAQKELTAKQRELLEEKEQKKRDLERAEKELEQVSNKIDKRFSDKSEIEDEDSTIWIDDEK